MAKLGLPIADKSLVIHPPLPPNIPLADEVRQTLALILGYSNSDRVPLRASPSGILFVASPRLVDVFHWTSSAPTQDKQGSNIPCSEVICVAHPDNTGRIWVRTKVAATSNNAFPLNAGDVIGFTVENLSELWVLIETTGEKAIVGYCL